MKLSSTSAQYETEIQNGIDLKGAASTIFVDDNTGSTGDFATLSGAITDSVGGASLTKTGKGKLAITGSSSNSYTGGTTFTGGTISLAKTGGAIAIPGNITISDGLARTYIILGGNNQIASSSVFSSTTPIYYGDLELNGYQQTLGGITSDAWATISNSGNANSTLTVNNSSNYTFSGKLLDKISGSTGTGKLALVKSGPGTLTLNGSSANAHTGGTSITGGTLVLAKTSGVSIPGALNMSAPSGSTLVIVSGANQFATSSVLNFQGGYWPHFLLNGNNVTVAGISDSYGTGVIENTQDGSAAAATITINNSANYSFNGYIRDHNAGSGTLALVKGGSGTLSLSGGASGGYTGGLTLNAGTLDYRYGVLPSCTITINGGTLIYPGQQGARPSPKIKASPSFRTTVLALSWRPATTLRTAHSQMAASSATPPTPCMAWAGDTTRSRPLPSSSSPRTATPISTASPASSTSRLFCPTTISRERGAKATLTTMER